MNDAEKVRGTLANCAWKGMALIWVFGLCFISSLMRYQGRRMTHKPVTLDFVTLAMLMVRDELLGTWSH